MIPLSDQQNLFLIETTQLYHAWIDAKHNAQQHKYGMRWVRSKDREYLVRLNDASGNGKSLGVRSAQTEAIYAAFLQNKARATTRLQSLTAQLKSQSKLNKALRMGRMPSVVADILQTIDLSNARDDFRLIGTHALYAYETMASVQCRMELLASGDVDLLFDPRKKLSVISQNLDGEGLLSLLQKADKSFQLQTLHPYRAVNDQGFMVDLIVPTQPMHKASIQFSEADFIAVEVPSVQWLANAPAVEVITLAANGEAVRVKVPDPRAFAIHKAWLSQQPEREPAKKSRDLNQAKLVYAMLRDHLPQYPLDTSQLKYMPAEVVEIGLSRLNT